MVETIHDTSVVGHSGILGTYQKVRRLLIWPNLKQSVLKYVPCEVCQMNRHENVATLGLLEPIPILEGAWEVVTMDFVAGLPKSDGKDVRMVVVNKFTKYCHLNTLTHPFKASDVAKTFPDSIYKLHGLPNKTITDKDLVFTSHFWKDVMGKLGIQLKLQCRLPPSK